MISLVLKAFSLKNSFRSDKDHIIQFRLTDRPVKPQYWNLC